MMTRFSPYALLLPFLLLTSCGTDSPPKDSPEKRSVEASSKPARPAGKSAEKTVPHEKADAGPAKAAVDPAPVLELLSKGVIGGARPISPRSMSLKIFFEGGDHGVFKPIRKDDRTARCEVAYYRLATAMGVRGVPPSTMCTVSAARLEGHLRKNFEEAASRFEELVRIDDKGMVDGAMISWVDGLEPSGLDGPGGWKKLSELLSLDGPSPEEEPLVAGASDMVVADYVLGNWDRYTGGNLFLSGDGTLVLLDNNAAFAPWSEGQMARATKVLELCQRFSRRLIGKLRKVDAGFVRTGLDGDQRGESLLTDGEIARILERREQLISHVDNLIALHGESRVLALP